MTKINLQVRIARDTRSKIAKLARHSKSAFVREAIEEKIQRETFRQMEEQWIRALKKHPDTITRDDKRWFKAQRWGEQ